MFGLGEWKELVNAGVAQVFSADQIDRAARLLVPAVKLALSGDLRNFAGLVNLERQSIPAEAFHRIYRGQHPTRRDKVILHLYDLSATDEKRAKEPCGARVPGDPTMAKITVPSSFIGFVSGG